MSIKYTDNKWIKRQATVIKNKFRKAGMAYSSGIQRELTAGAIIELRDGDGLGNCTVVLNKEQFDINKANILKQGNL